LGVPSLKVAVQCVRKAPGQLPNQELRFYPLVKVFEQSERISKVLLFSPDKICREIPRQRCFCNTKSNAQMMLCEECAEWYHVACIGMTQVEAEAAVDWCCGYCQSAPDADGDRTWMLAVPQGQRKRPKVAPVRNDVATPKARGVQPFNDDVVFDGPSSWDDCVELARTGGRKINLAEALNKKKALKIVNAGGHHVVDEVSLGGVQARGVDGALVDDLIGIGLLVPDDGGDQPPEHKDEGA
jgi:hypothetical protein